jgi:hypothetical protein
MQFNTVKTHASISLKCKHKNNNLFNIKEPNEGMAAHCGYFEATVVEALRKLGGEGRGRFYPFQSLFINNSVV